MLTKDVGTVLVGKEAVEEGIINEVGGISTRDTVGLLREEIISAIASPASTSPPIVFNRIKTPSIFLLSSIAASCGRICDDIEKLR